MLQDSGKKVVVLSRGHGGKAKSSVVVSNGFDITASLSSSGDEPMLLAKSLPGIPVVVGKDRRKSGRLAEELFNPDIILLDDGMQYWQLHRDINIAVLDAKHPYGSGFVMPAGDLREPIWGLNRADIIIINNKNSKECIKRELNLSSYHALVFKSIIVPVCFVNALNNEEESLDFIRNKKVAAFCGIGNPDAFFEMLNKLETNLIFKKVFSDHYIYSEEDLKQIKQSAADIIVTTEKDFVKLAKWQEIYDKLFVLRIKAEIEDNKRFEDHITSRINKQN
jgi:tetraacyldisaccharide 4'-kinase